MRLGEMELGSVVVAAGPGRDRAHRRRETAVVSARVQRAGRLGRDHERVELGGALALADQEKALDGALQDRLLSPSGVTLAQREAFPVIGEHRQAFFSSAEMRERREHDGPGPAVESARRLCLHRLTSVRQRRFPISAQERAPPEEAVRVRHPIETALAAELIVGLCEPIPLVEVDGLHQAPDPLAPEREHQRHVVSDPAGQRFELGVDGFGVCHPSHVHVRPLQQAENARVVERRRRAQ